MMKPDLKTLMAVAVIGASGSFAVAQQDADLDVNRPSEDRAVISIDRSQQDQQAQQQNQQRQQMGQDQQVAQDQKSVTGTVVSLEAFLREGEQAARQQTRAGVNDAPLVKALLADDGELYVILDRPGDSQRQAMGATGPDEAFSDWQQLDRQDAQARTGSQTTTDRDTQTFGMADPNAGEADANRAGADRDDEPMVAAPLSSDPEDPHKIQLSPGYELSQGDDGDSMGGQTDARADVSTGTDRASAGYEIDSDAQADVNVGTTAERSARAPIDVDADRDNLGDDQANLAPGRERHTNRADNMISDDQADANDLQSRSAQQQASGDVDSDSQVYGMADTQSRQSKQGKQAKQLKLGEKYTVTGEVYERNGMKGISVNQVSRAQ